MKKLLVFVGAFVAFNAAAQHRPFHYHPHYHRADPFIWVAPTIIGGVIGYEIARQQTQQVVIQQPPQVIIQGQNCTPWTEVQNPDGSITRTRTCTN